MRSFSLPLNKISLNQEKPSHRSRNVLNHLRSEASDPRLSTRVNSSKERWNGYNPSLSTPPTPPSPAYCNPDPSVRISGSRLLHLIRNSVKEDILSHFDGIIDWQCLQVTSEPKDERTDPRMVFGRLSENYYIPGSNISSFEDRQQAPDSERSAPPLSSYEYSYGALSLPGFPPRPEVNSKPPGRTFFLTTYVQPRVVVATF